MHVHLCMHVCEGRGVMQATALAKKLFLSLLVCVLAVLYFLPHGTQTVYDLDELNY